MIKPRDGFVHCGHCRGVTQSAPTDHDDFDAKRPRGGNLSVSRVAAAVFRNHRVDSMPGYQRAIMHLAKRSARGDVTCIRQRQRRIDWVDTAEQIEVLWRGDEWRQIVASQRDKDATRLLTERAHRCGRVVHFGPAITVDTTPRRPPQCNESHAGLAGGDDCVLGNRRRIRMRGIDQCIDTLFDQVVSEAVSAAKAANPYRHGMWNWSCGAAGQRQRDRQIATHCESLTEQAGFGRAAENEDAVHG